MKYLIKLSDVNLSNIDLVGGKNASIGELIQHLTKMGIKTPNGFAITTQAFYQFLIQNYLDKKIAQLIKNTKPSNIHALNKTSKTIQKLILSASFSPEFKREIAEMYRLLPNKNIAVRSSATTEDLINASFAGAQKTFLNVQGLQNLFKAIKLVYASLYTSRAIAYRHDSNFMMLSL